MGRSVLDELLIPPENVNRTKTEFLNRCSLKMNNNHLLNGQWAIFSFKRGFKNITNDSYIYNHEEIFVEYLKELLYLTILMILTLRKWLKNGYMDNTHGLFSF